MTTRLFRRAISPLVVLATIAPSAGCFDHGSPAVDAGRDAGPPDAAGMDSGVDATDRDAAPRDSGTDHRLDAGDLRIFQVIVEECRQLCMDSVDLQACTAACIRTEMEDALSMACADCFGAFAVCTVETGCSDECDSGWATDECELCRCWGRRNCGQEFWDCAGIAEYCPSTAVPGSEACDNPSDYEALIRLYPRRADGG